VEEQETAVCLIIFISIFEFGPLVARLLLYLLYGMGGVSRGGIFNINRRRIRKFVKKTEKPKNENVS
jgi:hypothetical protein